MILPLFLALWPVPYGPDARLPDHLLPPRAAEQGWVAEWQYVRARALDLTPTKAPHMRVVVQPSFSPERGYVIVYGRDGARVEGSRLRRGLAEVADERITVTRTADGVPPRLPEKAVAEIVARAGRVRCTAELSQPLADRFVNAVNRRLVRTRPGLVAAQPGEPPPPPWAVSDGITYIVEGVAKGRTWNGGGGPDIERLIETLDAMMGLCVQPEAGASDLEAALAALEASTPG